jgi:hypothetical protein
MYLATGSSFFDLYLSNGKISSNFSSTREAYQAGRKGLKIHGCSNGNSSEKWCFIFLQALEFLQLFRLH